MLSQSRMGSQVPTLKFPDVRVTPSGPVSVMSAIGPELNFMTGEYGEQPLSEIYDWHQDVARSAFADMLHDAERNQLYRRALTEAIDAVRSRGEKAKVLDIGTGTGLLAMMAAKHGADTVYACEASVPIARCAKEVIRDNGLEGKIRLIPKRSTGVTVGPGQDMEEKANILVTEVFDTELIGECAIETFTDALERLLEPGCQVVPHAATVYAQVVHSPFLRSHHSPLGPVLPAGGGHLRIEVPTEGTCPGSPSLHDLQLSQLREGEDFTPLTAPLPVFRFDFTDAKTLPDEECTTVAVEAAAGGTCHAVLMWWELDMNPGGSIRLSCAPYWAHPAGKEAPWRDHWMQAAYYPPCQVDVRPGQRLHLTACRDAFSLWFSVSLREADEVPQPPHCSCGLHNLCSRSRLAMLNDDARNAKYAAALRRVVTGQSVCLCVGNGSLLPLMAAKLGAKKVFVLDSDDRLVGLLESYAKHNGLLDRIHVLPDNPSTLEEEKADVVLSEPFFSFSLLPWHNLHFWALRHSLSPLLHPKAVTLPAACALYGVAVQFRDLWKIRAPVGEAEGFQLAAFDRLIESSRGLSDDTVEPQPLWEYPGTALTQPFQMLALDLSAKPGEDTVAHSGRVKFQSNGLCNGVALWADFRLDEQNVISTGPTQLVIPGREITWDRYSRQGVRLFRVGYWDPAELLWSVHFNPCQGSLTFAFDIIRPS